MLYIYIYICVWCQHFWFPCKWTIVNLHVPKEPLQLRGCGVLSDSWSTTRNMLSTDGTDMSLGLSQVGASNNGDVATLILFWKVLARKGLIGRPCAWKNFNFCIALIFKTYTYLIILSRGQTLVAACLLAACCCLPAAACCCLLLLAAAACCCCFLPAAACLLLACLLAACLLACLLACVRACLPALPALPCLALPCLLALLACLLANGICYR